MINNRQNGRRGRGRNNNPRPQGGGGPRAEQGNRIDNRARGNASQLHEKYKTLARDAQMQGDRVMTEYYLQFADHYFRVLSEGQRRFEEQRPPRQDAYGQTYQDEGEDGDEPAGDEGYDEPRATQPRRDDARQDGGRQDGNRPNAGRPNEGRRGEGRVNEQGEGRHSNDGRQNADGRQNERAFEPRRDDGRPAQRDDRYTQDRAPRQDRGERPDRNERQPRVTEESRRADPVSEAPRADARPAELPAPVEAQPAPVIAPTQPELGYEAPVETPRPRRGRPPKVRPDAAPPVSEANGVAPGPGERLDMAVLPPSIAPSAPSLAVDGEGGDEAPRRRRTRRPRVDAAENDTSGEAAA